MTSDRPTHRVDPVPVPGQVVIGDPRFELLIDSITGYGIYMLDADGRVASWNRGAEAMKGYAAQEIEGEPFARFFTLEDRRGGLPERLLAQARRTGRVESEGWRVRKDGSRFWAVAMLHALTGDDGELVGYAKVTRDMTDQRAAQETLQESERRFRLLVEGVVDYAIYMLDVNGVVTNWNRGAERIKGYDAQDIVGHHFGIFYTPGDRAAGRPAKALATALAEGRFEGEGWRLRKDGSQFWASVVIDPIHDDDGRHIGYAKITRDISERKAAEEALSQSERQFRMLVGGVTDYALYMLDPNGIITNWNSGAERIKGYSAEEVIGQHVARFYTPVDRAAGLPLKALNTAAETGRFEAEGWRVRKDGVQFWANVVVDAIRDEDGELVGFAKITRDITEKRSAEIELRKAQERAAQSQKMEALGQLTGGVAHDFNNLLMVVNGQAEIIRHKLHDPDRVLRAVDAIEASARRGEDLTRHLLSFSRRQRLRSTVAPLGDCLAGMGELAATSLPPQVTLNLRLPGDLWLVEADQSELELALLNLVVNARDAMPGGGRITISGRNVAEGELTDTDIAGDFLEITVADEGVGIPPDILERIFEPFFTTKEVDKGTGLGLAQVFGFAKQAGGTVRVETELGRGTKFHIHLPRSDAERTPTGDVREPAPLAPAGSVSILLVEDNPEVAEVSVALLEQLGHRVRLVGNAAAALSALQDAQPFDLVFSDIVMAGEMDGIGLAQVLRERHPELPVLLATGYSQAAGQTGDAFPILSKPYTLEQLARAIPAVLASRMTDGGDKLVPLDRMRAARAARKTSSPS